MTAQHPDQPIWDMFCKVVDNFGDIGVCWRLARQLADEQGITLRLWVDDIALAQQFAREGHPHVDLQHWTAQTDFTIAAPVVIETFGCGLPERYQQVMTPNCLWLNVDYLSAENWVEGFHGRPSPQANGLIRYFFYPGFSRQTGGLLRERFLPALHLETQSPAGIWRRLGLEPIPETINISLFCYPQAPIRALWDSLAASPQPVRLIVPDSVAPFVAQATGLTLNPGQTIPHQNGLISVIPFLPQMDYDRLLALCDLNFVRGEDSWIRAIWAGKPMIWLPYPQSENTHLHKLDAFLQRYLADAGEALKTQVESIMQAWARNEWSTAHWQAWINHRKSIASHAGAFANQLSQQPDLATNIVIFIEKLRANQV